jgi:hypothetical protein
LCLLATQEAGIRRIMVQARWGKKLVRPLLNKKVSCGDSICHASYVGGMGRKTAVLTSPKQKHETLSKKITKAKRGGDWLKW